MPPVVAQDPFVAVHQALHARWLDVPMAILGVLFEAWVLALVALALYSWLERDVAGVLRSFAPLATALAVGAVLVLVLRQAWAAPHPVGSARGVAAALAPVLHPSGQAAHAATFAAYTIRRYGRRGLFAVAFPVLAAASRIYAGPDWPLDLAFGLVLGTALGVGGWWLARRLLRMP
jgi:membrane-associated phospholipid phosphatase